MKILRTMDVAEILGRSPTTIRDPRFRARARLPAVRIAGRLGFRAEDIERIIKDGLEEWDMEPYAGEGASE